MRGTTKRKMFAHPKTSAGKRSEPEVWLSKWGSIKYT
jgi:hypothetical protein